MILIVLLDMVRKYTINEKFKIEDLRSIGRPQINKNQLNMEQRLFHAEVVILKTCKPLAVLH